MQGAASERKNLIAGEIAAGRNPKLLLEQLVNPPEPVKRETLADVAPRYKPSRIDYSQESHGRLDSHLKRILAWAG